MKTKLWYALPLLAVLGSAYASDDDVSPEILAQIQADCASDGVKAGMNSEDREIMNWLCVSNLRDYDNSISDD